MFRHAATWLSLLMLPVLVAAPVIAEAITVGPSGCDQTTLAGAILRAAITAESDTIYFGADQTWSGSGALLLINESSVTLQGVRGCSDLVATPRSITTTVGDLFEFDNTNATFRDLRLVGDTGGRLITATNGALVSLEDTLVRNGRADDGGNIHLSGGASVVALAGTQISNGDATFNGGGVYCTGTGVVGLGEETKLHGNNAGFNGGGVYVDDCSLNILTGGPAPPGIGEYGIVDNRADFNGGGVYATNGASVLLSGHGTRPGSIIRNDAVGFGGGMYLTGLGTTAEVFNSEIVANRGFGRAGGVMVTAQANLLMDRTVAECDRGILCSRLADNGAGISSPAVSEGGGLYVSGGGDALIRQTYVSGNNGEDGGNVALVTGGGSFALFENSVLYDNNQTGVHVVARDGGWARLAFVSAWGSSTPANGTAFGEVGTNGRIDLYSSVVIEGRGSVLGGGGPDPVFLPVGSGGLLSVDCVIVHETSSTGGAHTVVTDPAVVWSNPAAGDPHLLTTSPAIDFCDDLAYAPVDNDIDNQARGFDVTTIPDGLGPFDLGADEWVGAPPPVGVPFFADDFESGNVSVWSSSVP